MDIALILLWVVGYGLASLKLRPVYREFLGGNILRTMVKEQFRVLLFRIAGQAMNRVQGSTSAGSDGPRSGRLVIQVDGSVKCVLLFTLVLDGRFRIHGSRIRKG